MKQRLMQLILKALNAADGMPMPESALVSAVQGLARPADPTDGDVLDALKECQALKWVEGVSDVLTGRSWTLTTSGTHRARKL